MRDAMQLVKKNQLDESPDRGLYHELAYCLVRLGEVRGRGSKALARFYESEAKRLRGMIARRKAERAKPTEEFRHASIHSCAGDVCAELRSWLKAAGVR